MPCYDPIQFLKTEIGRFGQMIPEAIYPMSPIISLLPKGMFPVERGRNQQLIRYLPSRPLKTDSDFSLMFSGDGEIEECASTAGPCTPTARQLGAVAEAVSYAPKWAWWKSPKFCHNEMITAWNVAEQLSSVFRIVTDNVKEDYERELYFDLINLASNTVMPYGTEGNAVNVEIFTNGDPPDICPTCPLTLGTLEAARINGYENGYLRAMPADNVFGMRDGVTNGLLITSMEASANMIQYDVRARSVDGYRYNTDIQSLHTPSESKFLSRFGIRAYAGFNILNIPFPRRGTCSGGTFTPVPDSIIDPSVPEDCEDAAPGRVATLINPAWRSFETAPIEEAILLLRNDIFQVETWPVVRRPGGAVEFSNAINMMGEWEHVDWRDCVENPLGLFSYAQAVHAYAPKPMATFGAYKIYFQRCPISGTCGPCS
jgi:hypothetical protein